MTDLIHSMAEFGGTIANCLKAAKAQRIVAVGTGRALTEKIAAQAGAEGRVITIGEGPAPIGGGRVVHDARLSLQAMPEMSDIHAWVIDGDHNYYTAFRELEIADRLSRRDGRPLLAFVHHVSWPCARRDMYKSPEAIPAAHRHPSSTHVGVTLGNDGALPHRGLRGIGGAAFALRAGGPRNGVLTAVEDFLAGARGEGRQLAFALVPAVFGLGVVFAADAAWSGDVASVLLPFHDNPLIARMEEDRLRNHLELLDAQDRRFMAAAAA